MSWSGFLCKTCRKVVAKMKSGLKELENRVLALEMERDGMTAKMGETAAKVDKCEGEIKGVETGLKKAKEDVKNEVKNDLKEIENRSENVVIYGLEESEEEDGSERKREDLKKMRDLMKEIEVEENEVDLKAFRAGKKRDDGKPRPMIVTITEAETRHKVLANARKLATKDEAWKKVYVAPDMTFQQREEARKMEAALRAEADEKNQALDEGKLGKWIVVGPRGRRWLKWLEEKK